MIFLGREAKGLGGFRSFFGEIWREFGKWNQITRQFTTPDTRRIDATQDLQTDTDAHYLSPK